MRGFHDSAGYSTYPRVAFLLQSPGSAQNERSRPMHVVRAERAIESEGSPGPTVHFDELSRRIEDGDVSWVLLNVLPRAAFEAGRIPGSLNLPLAELAERAGEVLPARDQETAVYCGSAACSLA